MDKLIEFLVHNIYIVIIVIGFLFSMISKAKGRGAPPRMPDFSGNDNRPGSGLPRPGRAEQQQTYEAGRSWPQEASPASDSWGEQEEMSGEGVSLEQPDTRRSPVRESPFASSRQIRSSSPPARKREQSAPSRLLETGGDELRKAVIWAEIMGPPRAKRPFRRP